MTSWHILSLKRFDPFFAFLIRLNIFFSLSLLASFARAERRTLRWIFVVAAITFLFSLLFIAVVFWISPYTCVLPAVNSVVSVVQQLFSLHEMRLLHVIGLFKGNTEAWLMLDVAVFLLFFFSTVHQCGRYFCITRDLPQWLLGHFLRCYKQSYAPIMLCLSSGMPEGMLHNCLDYFCNLFL